ncbi:MAG: Uma2 family endonuclease [Bacteroidota bacterium]
MPSISVSAALQDILASPGAVRLHAQLSRELEDEAMRRAAFLDAITPDDKAEFINGHVIMHSPAHARHNQAVGNLYTLLRLHVTQLDLGLVGVEKWLVSLTRNDYEPDVCFWPRTVADRFTPDQMRFPAPAFIAEVLSASTRTRDLGVKLEDYAAHDVAEYWVIDPDAATLSQYLLRGPAYELALRSNSGEVTSEAIDGFRLAIPALFQDAAFQHALNAGRSN